MAKKLAKKQVGGTSNITDIMKRVEKRPGVKQGSGYMTPAKSSVKPTAADSVKTKMVKDLFKKKKGGAVKKK